MLCLYLDLDAGRYTIRSWIRKISVGSEFLRIQLRLLANIIAAVDLLPLQEMMFAATLLRLSKIERDLGWRVAADRRITWRWVSR